MNHKYPEVTGSWTYGHIVIPVKLIYIGSSDQPKCHYRWNPGGYKGTELYPYIEQYGWNNIKHIVFKDGLTPKQAEQLEGLLIAQATIDGWCINKYKSGINARDSIKEYHKQYYKQHKKQFDKRNKKRLSTSEGIIYNRVSAYNQYHQDSKIITPSEAKEMYILTGYIPNFIKNDDLL